jgi:hypothetical protein
MMRTIVMFGLLLLLVACTGNSGQLQGPQRLGGVEGGPAADAEGNEGGIPRGVAAERYHESQLAQLREAHLDEDGARMRQILSLPRAGATGEQLQRFVIFERLMRGLLVREELLERRGFVCEPPEKEASEGDEPSGAPSAERSGRDPSAPPEFEMDERIRLALLLQPRAGHEFRIAAEDAQGARTLITVRASIEDHRSDGSMVRFEEPIVRGIQKDVTLSAAEPLRLPLQEPGLPGPDVVVRIVRFEGEMRPAGLEVDGEAAATIRIRLEPLEIRRFAKGFDKVRAQPLLILRNALSGSPSRYAGHVYVACWFLNDASAAQREEALGLLIQSLRSRPREATRTILSCLERLAGSAAPTGRDRDSWLTWWSLRSKSQR